MKITRRGRSRALAFAILCLALFILLLTAIATDRMLRFDSVVRTGIHEYASATMTEVMRGFAILGSLTFLVAASLTLIVIFNRIGERQTAARIAWVMTGAILLENILKYSIHRARPEPFFGNAPHTYSFPSGHALFAVCFYGTIASPLSIMVHRPAIRAAIWIAAAFLIFAIGLSRVYLGVHYPSDVIGGYLTGAFWLGAVAAVREAPG